LLNNFKDAGKMTPRLYLVLDNCFASKRWTEPLEWMTLARDMGYAYIEASADNECDPLYSTPETLTDWMNNIRQASEETGVKVVNFYSGHGTYATLGLAHNDPRVRDHIQHDWLEVMIRNAVSLGAGLGFFCHAFSQSVLADPARYAQAEEDLYTRLGQLARYAAEVGMGGLNVEQMYSPHQIPWTLAGTEKLLREVYGRAGHPIYLTLDTGHQVGQQRFLKPEAHHIEAYISARREGMSGAVEEPWLGGAEVFKMIDANPHQPLDALVDEIAASIAARPYLFAEEEDGDLYAWLRRFGCYSPIIHLQQTDGTASAHRPFTAKYNATGIVQPDKVFAALAESYQHAMTNEGYPPPYPDIYLTVEVFSGTAERPGDIIRNLTETARYWRRFLPEDGMMLDQVLSI
jgi:D-erythrulose 1-phosphate 3-epimerase